jgi:hypothetical protein
MVSVADTSVIQGKPNTTFDRMSSIWTGNHDGFCTDDSFNGGASRGLLRFDLSGVPANKPITRATLHLRAVGVCYGTSGSASVNVSPAMGEWAVSTATWENQPPIGVALGAINIPFEPAPLAWYQIDVTGQVQHWASGTDPNYGLILTTGEGSGDDFVFVAFASSEWSEYAPYIEVAYGAQAASAAQIASTPAATPVSSVSNQ